MRNDVDNTMMMNLFFKVKMITNRLKIDLDSNIFGLEFFDKS